AVEWSVEATTRRPSEQLLRRSLHLVTSAWPLTVPQPETAFPWLPAWHLPLRLASADARRARHDGAVLLDGSGAVAAASRGALIVVIDGPPLLPAAPAPPDAAAAEWLLRALGAPAALATLSRGDLYAADEAFLVSGPLEVEPIRSVDDRDLGPV